MTREKFYFFCFLVGCFNNFILVSTSVIKDQTGSMLVHNIQADQGDKTGMHFRYI